MVLNGISRVLHGVMKYRAFFKENMVEQFKKIRDNPDPSALIISCADSRVLPSRFIQANIGDTFFIRNAGNIVPQATNMGGAFGCPEPAVLELACVINQVRDIIVCGHSDCKAMNCLYDISKENIPASKLEQSQLQSWILIHGNKSLELFEKMREEGWEKPLTFMTNTCVPPLTAFIDPQNKFSVRDKLSQINTLQQLQNITTYNFLKNLLETGEIKLHAMWFNVYNGDVYYFSRDQEHFIEINDETYDELINEAFVTS